MIKDPIDTLRELAKTDYYQAVYNNAKELGMQMFENTYNFTRLQLMFLSFAGMYSCIQTDIAMGDIGERVLDNFIYEDAYMHWKRVSSTKDIKKKISSIKQPKGKGKEEYIPKSTWSFKRTK